MVNDKRNISGVDFQTGYNFSILEPSFRESDGMIKVDDSFSRDDMRIVDAVFDEGFLRGLNFALNSIKDARKNKPKNKKDDWYEACDEAVKYISNWRGFLLGQNGINLGDDKALFSKTPFIDALTDNNNLNKKGDAENE